MKPNFTVIRGGKSLSPECRGRKFVSGYATNTRLMGVIGLELKWDVVEDSQVKTLNQIFYLDAEEFGLESYTVGSSEFTINYAARNDVISLMDNGHYHPKAADRRPGRQRRPRHRRGSAFSHTVLCKNKQKI